MRQAISTAPPREADRRTIGTVFKLTPSGGSWTESVLHSFCSAANCTDGVEPVGGVVLDVHDNIYGVTPGGGTLNLGVAYELSQSGGSGQRPFSQNFCENCTSGYHPQQTMILDANGNLYGNTYQGWNADERRSFRVEPDRRRPVDRDRALQLLLGGRLPRWRISLWPDALRCARQFIRRYGRWRTVWRGDGLRVIAAPDSYLDHVDQRSESLCLWTDGKPGSHGARAGWIAANRYCDF